MTKSLAELSLHAYTLSMPLLPIGIPKGKLQLKLQLLALNLWQPELLQIKSLTSGTLSCILESQSDPYLLVTSLLLTAEAYPPPLCPRNELWLHMIESGRMPPIQLERWKL